MASDTNSTTEGLAPRWRFLILLSSLLAGPLLAEGLMRALLFGKSGPLREWGAGLRDASLFADPRLDQEYWLLRPRLRERELSSASFPDPLLGWVSYRVEPETYRHRDPLPEGKRPILLYGASYASCVSETRDSCFEELLAETELAGRHTLLNFGVGGYGVDQAYLLFRESIAPYIELDPVVVFLLVIDTDFDRASLGFRAWPKPQLTLEGPIDATPPPTTDPEDYLDSSDTGIRSYAWSYVLHGTEILPPTWRDRWTGRLERRARQTRVVQRALRGIHEVAQTNGVETFFILCSSPAMVRRSSGPEDGRTQFLMRELNALGLPYKLSGPAFAAASVDGAPPLFLSRGAGINHPTRRGNLVLLDCLSEGIAGHFDGP